MKVVDIGRVPLYQNFRKFRFKIEWNRKFLETHFKNLGQHLEVVLFWKFGNWKFSAPFGLSNQYKLALVPLALNIASTKATRWRPVDTTLDAKRSATVQAFYWLPILHKNVRIHFSGKFWTSHSKFPVGICLVCMISREKSSPVSYDTKIILESVW